MVGIWNQHKTIMKSIGRLGSVLFLLLSIATTSFGQGAKPGIFRADPPFWWIGMNSNRLQLLVLGEGIAQKSVSVNASDLRIEQIHKFSNPDYIAIDLVLGSDFGPGSVDFIFEGGGKKESLKYEFRQRRSGTSLRKGPNGSDVIYLAMPDRFSNGNPKNDDIKGMNQRGIDRDSMFYRHGGDLEGITNHLDYLADLGISALWLNPVQENNEPKESYHGYAITDHYTVDSRFGTNEDYRNLSAKAHEKGIKMVADFVYNHWGDKHYLNRRLPSQDWIHHQNNFQRTSYRAPTLSDPHASMHDKQIFSDGWFDHHMPDINQKNTFVANYLIQNTLWWIEYADLDGVRIDTYLYSDLEFMRDLVARIRTEYPSLTIFGETWVHGVGIQAFVCENNFVQKDAGNLPGVTDFQLYYAINDALTKKMGWTDGVAKMYYMLAQDYFYKDANRNVIFLDNHDLSRFYSVVGEDIDKFKMGIAWLMTMRGIPQLYYGTEILMKNFADPDGKVRGDFPGGWAADAKNKFKAEGRSEKENEAFQYIRKLIHWRKGKELFNNGDLMQFVPIDGVYVYFRYNDDQTVMVIMNCNEEVKKIQMARFAEQTEGHKTLKNVISETSAPIGETLSIPAWTTWIFELN